MSEIRNIVIGGKNDIAVRGTQIILDRFPDLNIFVIMNQSDDGVDGFQRSFLKFSNTNGLKIISLEETYEIDDGMFLSLEFDRLLVPERFKMERLINIHFSALPEYKGMYTSHWPIRNGEETSGVTLHRIDPGIDTGEIIDQTVFELSPSDTCRDLYAKYIKNGVALVDSNIQALIKGTFKAVPQPVSNSSYYSKKSIDFSCPEIDLKQTAINIGNQIRAFSFREYQLPTLDGCPVFGFQILEKKGSGRPGRLVDEEDDFFVYTTVDFDIKIFKDRLDELLTCCKQGELKNVKDLLENRALIDEHSVEGVTPLIVAVEAGQFDVAQLLLLRGACVETPSYAGISVLEYATNYAKKSGDKRLVELIETPFDMEPSQKKDGGVAIRNCQPKDQEAVIALWKKCGLVVPWNHPKLDFDRKLQFGDKLFLLANIKGLIVGSVMGGYDGHRGSINYVAVHPDYRGRGIGRKLMENLGDKLLKAGCPRLKLAVRQNDVSTIDFFKAIGFVVDDVITMGWRLKDDR
jgi:methionyl-tRNA formyltransferase